MIDLILTAGPVFAIMLSPLMIPIASWTFGLVADRFRAAPEPGAAERLAARRAAHRSASTVEVVAEPGSELRSDLRAA